MALIKLEIDYPIQNGSSVTFKAPCDSTEVTGIKVYYPNITESEVTTVSKTFAFMDCHLNALTSLGNLFTTGAYLKAILDVTNGYAFIQNADTNAYLEGKIVSMILEKDVVVEPSAWVSSTEHERYPYKATISITGATENMIPEVNFSLADAIGDNFAPVAQSVSGGVVIYARKAQTSSVTIPTVILWVRGEK